MFEYTVRWDAQRIKTVDDAAPGLPGLPSVSQLVHTVQTPEFASLTFHEVLAKSALNQVPGAAHVPFSWTINPYRGCSHACTYCFARRTHSYLELDTGTDFVVVMAPDRTRWSHPDPDQLGRPFLGTVGPALAGETFTETLP